MVTDHCLHWGKAGCIPCLVPANPSKDPELNGDTMGVMRKQGHLGITPAI
jgi:hypothetical protein